MMNTEDQKAKATADKWLERIRAAKIKREKFVKQAKRVEKIYEQDDKSSEYNILWSNVQITHGALYSSTPKPDIRKRYKDGDDAAKKAALVLERAIDYYLDTSNFDDHMDDAVDSYLVSGEGVVRVKYLPEFAKDERGDEYISDQLIDSEFYSYDNFIHEPAKRWEDVSWIAFECKKTTAEIKKEFDVDEISESVDDKDKHSVYEVYHKPTRTIIVVTGGHDHALDIRKDELGLKNFFPCAKPIISNKKKNELTPQPDYLFYEPQAQQLSRVSKRIKALVDSIKDVGFYDADLIELANLTKKQDGELIPVKNLISRLNDSNSLKAVIAKMPIEDRAAVIVELRNQVDALKAEIYEIVGISDIVRGASQASESATAQSIKDHWANIRIGRRQKAVALMVRDTFRIISEIIAEHFQPEILSAMTGIEVTDDVIALLRSDLHRGFSIDIETDSTIAKDDQEERQQRLEFLSTVTEYVNGILPAVQSGAMNVELAKELILNIVRTFKHSTNLEELIQGLGSTEQEIQRLQQQLQEQQQQIEQVNAEAQQAVSERDYQIQQLQEQLSQVNEREEIRKDAEAQANVTLKQAQAQKHIADANKAPISA